MLSGGRRAGAVALLAAAWALGTSAPALADGGVQCPPYAQDCNVWAGSTPPPTGGGGGNTGGGGGGDAARCMVHDQQVPCYRDGVGWFNPSNYCYYQLLDPQPGPDDPVWQGPVPVYAKAYTVNCPYDDRQVTQPSGVVVLSTPPPGFGGMVSPAELAQRALDSMRLTGADIGTAPRQGSTSLVGLPVWVWNTPSATTWGPVPGQASVPGLTVRASGHVSSITWDFGDGASTTCSGPGTPYQASFGTRAPDCGHTYTKAGRYTVTATSHWVVDWTSSDGQSGRLTTTRTSSSTVDLAEAQAINTR